jgi:hypothetical protein
MPRKTNKIAHFQINFVQNHTSQKENCPKLATEFQLCDLHKAFKANAKQHSCFQIPILFAPFRKAFDRASEFLS